MTTFDRREQAFENMFAHEEEVHFLEEAHRTKLLGAWVARKTGKMDAEGQAYAADLVTYSVAHGGEEALFQRVRADLPSSVADTEIREQMATFLAESVSFVRTS